MPIRFDKWNSAYDPREAELNSLFGQPPSPDEIVDRVALSFAHDLARILHGQPGEDAVESASGGRNTITD